jgi:hypothetical protein
MSVDLSDLLWKLRNAAVGDHYAVIVPTGEERDELVLATRQRRVLLHPECDSARVLKTGELVFDLTGGRHAIRLYEAERLLGVDL